MFRTLTQSYWGTVTKEQIKKTQREWILYRDAWVEFMRIHCPDINENSIKTILTEERAEQLSDFTPDSKSEEN